jgi:5-methylcytosine-specific restriction endonuclease McrA
MGRSLVLNASYEPLSVVPARRAVVLVLDEKADVIHETDTALHSERLTVAVPSVIRLRYFVRVPFRRSAALSRRGVFMRDSGQCQYCGKRADSIDHIVPRSRGGGHTWDNVVAACGRCNAVKRDRLLEETTMRLRRHPQTPHHLSWVAVAVTSMPSDWAQYLGVTAAISA